VKVQTTTLAILFADAAIFGAFSLVIATDMPLSELSTINAACRVQRVPFYASCTFGMYGFIFADLLQHDFVIEREQSNIITRLGPESGTRSIIGTAVLRQPDGKVMERVTKREIYTPILLANTSSLPGYNLSTWKRKMAVSPLLSCIRALWEYQSQTKLPKPSRSATDLTLFTTLATDKHKELQLPPETLRSEVLRSFMQNLGSEISPVCAFLGGQLAQDAINVIGGKGQPIQNMLIFDGDEFTGHVYALHSHVSAAIPREPTTGRPVVPPRFVGIPNGTALSRALMESNPAVQANMTAKGDSWDDVIAQGGQSSL
jgi:ubiquitin-like 1-activating enzyme E1 A